LGATQLGDLTYTYDGGGQRVAVGGSWARTNLPTALASATYDAANQIATFATPATPVRHKTAGSDSAPGKPGKSRSGPDVPDGLMGGRKG
jgi:hypothetical protein